MSNTILLCSILAILAISILWNLLRGLSKSRVRGICILLSAVAAVGITMLVRPELTSEAFQNETLIPMLQEMAGSEIADALGFSPTLNEALINVIVSLISPIICLILFWVFCILTWIVFFIISLVFRRPFKNHNRNALLSPVRAIAWGAVQGIVIVVILLIPITSYLGMVPPVMNALDETDMLGENEEEVMTLVNENVIPLQDNAFVVVYNSLGGKGLNSLLTDFELNGNKTVLTDELESISTFACNLFKLTESEFAEYGSAEALVFISIADSFDGSVLLPTIAGEFIYGATDAWLQDQPFFGVEMPSMGEGAGELIDPMLSTLLQILHDDARNTAALQNDIRTVATMISIMAENGVFANLSDTDALLESLSSGGIVEGLVNEIGKNDSMKQLIPEITNLGMRAIATALGIPADVEAVYGEFLDEVAGALNEVLALPEAERVETLTAKLTTAFDEAGIPVDKEIIACYAGSMTADLLNAAADGELTSEDVQAFFALYAANVATDIDALENEGSTTVLAARGTRPLADLSALLAGTVYEGKTEEELSKSGAAVLAQVTIALVSLDTTESAPPITEQAATIIKEVYSTIAEEESPIMAVVTTVKITKPVAAAAVKATAGLQSSDEMVTQKVTLGDLLVDTKEAASKINTETLEKEVAAITSIFSAATTLTGQLGGNGGNGDNGGASEIKIGEIAGTVGGILDSLNATETFGSDKTSGLFTAVLQSNTVRDVANLDMETATQMAQKATEGDVNYTETFGTVASGVEVFTKLGGEDGQISEEELIELIRTINPQTAGMIEVFVTAERLMEYGMPETYASIASDLVSGMFGVMADMDSSSSDEEFANEAKALNQILTIALKAEEDHDGKLFGDILPPADEAVSIFMSSKSIKTAICNTMLDAQGNVIEEKRDAFGIGAKLAGAEDTVEYHELVDAIQNYYTANHSVENGKTLKALAALLGVEVDIH